MHDEVADVMTRAQAELDRLKAESRSDQWEPCRSLVLATEEWVKMEDQASKSSACLTEDDGRSTESAVKPDS
jgi:hypothetical protein